MTLDKEYVRICDLFEDMVKRAAQIASLAAVLQDAIISPDNDQKALYHTAWLLSELLQENHVAIARLQAAHIKGYMPPKNK